MKDITESVKNAQTHDESQKRLSLVLDATEDGIWDWNMITNEEFFSPRWCEIIGYEYNDPKLPHNFDSWKSRIHPDDFDRVMNALNDHLNSGAVYNVDYRHRHKSGQYRWQNSRGKALFDENGKPFRMVGCIRDITDQKKIEQDMKELIQNLEDALSDIKTLQGIIPVCSYCNEIQNDKGSWEKMEAYLASHIDVDFSHGVCPECFHKVRRQSGLLD